MPHLTIAGDRKLYFECHRGRRAPILLIHGWGVSSRVWDTTASALLDAGHTVVLFDQRGCGLSDKDFAENSISRSACDVVALVRYLGIDRVVLNGWSLGGAIGVEAAGLLGSACAGLVLTTAVSPRYVQAGDFPHGAPAGSAARSVAALRQDRVNFLAALNKAVCAIAPSAAVENWLLSIFLQTSYSADVCLAELDSIDQRDLLGSLDIPVLSVVGGKDLIVAPEIGRFAAQAVRHGRLVEFPDCGHAPFLEDGPAYRSALLQFLGSLDV
jgi:non-heme chloroperoxidase